MEFNKKIVAFDLDGTLTESNQPMQKNTAMVLFDLLCKTKVAIITGASFVKMKEQLNALFSLSDFSKHEATEKNLYILPTNGLVIYQYKKEMNDWCPISASARHLEEKEKIIEALEEIIASGGFDIPKVGKGNFISDRGNQISFAGLGEKAPLEEKRVWDPDHKKRQQIKKVLEKKIKNADFVIGGNTTIDILPKGFNKGIGLTNFISNLKISNEDLLFIGDAIFLGGNDYSVKEAGFESIKVEGPEETIGIIKDLTKKV